MDHRIKKIFIIEYFIAFLIILFGLLLSFYPKLRYSLELLNQIKHNKQVVEMSPSQLIGQQKKKNEEQLDRKLEKLQFIRGMMNRVKSKIDQTKNVAFATLEIEKLATRSGLEMSSIKPLESIASQKYEMAPIALGFKSSYEKLVEFLSLLEKSSVPMAAQQLSISKKESLGAQLDAGLTLYVLFLAADEQ